MAGGKHHPRRDHGAHHYPPPERSRRAGNRGISSQQDRDVMIRILDFKDASGLITRKAVRLGEAEQIVAPILDDVRQRGDRALLEYARKFDGFSGDSVRMTVCRVAHQADAERGRDGRREYSRTCSHATPRGRIHRLSGRAQAGPNRAAARFDGRIYSRRPLSPAIDIVDDGDSRAGSRRRDHLCRVSESERGNFGHRASGWA